MDHNAPVALHGDARCWLAAATGPETQLTEL